jgi:hypothetical protein
VIRALLDTDVILDLVLARAPFVEDAAVLGNAHANNAESAMAR